MTLSLIFASLAAIVALVLFFTRKHTATAPAPTVLSTPPSEAFSALAAQCAARKAKAWRDDGPNSDGMHMKYLADSYEALAEKAQAR